MAENKFDEQALIKQFLDALSLRHMAQCEHALAALQALAFTQPSLLAWCDYLTGVLANERDHDWAAAERIFSRLLHASELDLALHGRVLVALGRTYEYQGRWSTAIDTHERSLPIFARLNQPLDQIKAHKNIAIAYAKGRVQGEFGAQALEDAVIHCQRALAMLAGFADPLLEDLAWLKGSVLNTLGITYMNLEQWDEAIACYEQDLAICRALDDRFGIGISYGNLGEVYQRRGPDFWPHAEAAYQQALHLIREFGNLYQETDVLANLGSLYRSMGEHALALEQYDQAIELIEGLRARVSSEEARTGFFTTVVDTYASAVQLLLEAGHVARAFDTVERARSRAFIELLAQQAIRPSPQVPTFLLQQEQEIRAQLGQLYASSQGQSAQTQRLEQQLDEVQRQVRLLDAEYAAFHTVDPLTHEQIQARLPADTALLSYFTAGDRLFAFVVRRDQLTVHALALTTQALARVFDANGHLHRLLPDSHGRLHQPWLLERLYQGLIAPLASQLQAQRALWIVPHGALHYVPFHALAYAGAEGQPRALLDDYEILYAPSATVLLEYCQRKPIQATQRGLAVGYNETDLHHAEAEATAIAGIIGGATLVGRKASRSAVLRQAQHQRWLHLSCHGRFNTHAPLTSHLLLADGPLYAVDVLRELQLEAELVTLSACETGRSQVLKGDELIGLVRAFIYAGTPSVLVSLWPVDEISTRMLMEHFYRAILAGQTKTVALRTAQQSLRQVSAHEVEATLAAYGEPDPASQVERLRSLTGNEQIFAHPYFWAPFILVGDRLSQGHGQTVRLFQEIK